MQINNFEQIIISIVRKISRIAYLLNLQKANVSVILVSVFYFIFHLFINIFLNPVFRQKR
jgi:hypothetical protein